MKNFLAALVAILFGAFLASCDLQPKISSIPDSVGDFISMRYPAMLADPDTEPEIYNSAVSDYGVYASPELYGSGGMDDYVNYVGVDDYVLKSEPEDAEIEPVESESAPEPKAAGHEKQILPESKTNTETSTESVPDDVLNISEYKSEVISVPARAGVGTVVVRRGDTLYSIAREHETTVDELARVNNLKAPYTVKIGQTLKLKSEPAPVPVAAKPKTELVPAKPAPTKKIEPVKQAEPAAAPTKSVEQKSVAKPVEQKPAAKPAAKVAAEKTKDVRVAVKTVTVARGDTLYSLSRKYEVPVNDLAVMNNLRAPFALTVGQKLRVPDLPDAPAAITAPVPAKAAVQSKAEVKTNKKEAKNVAEKTKSNVPAKTTKVADKPVKKTENKSVQKQTKTEPKKQTAKAETKSAPAAKPPTPTVPARSSSKFTWPVRGAILSHYGAKTGGLYNDGINISAAAGTTVVAAENGVVAYAGNEVRGMGNLVIIQHADGWMTVYAHLNSMAVRRGVRVSVGQKIGTVGQTGKVTAPQLHFEIRKGTKSYNPTNYLKK